CRNWRDVEVVNLLRTPQSACQRDAEKFRFEEDMKLRISYVPLLVRFGGRFAGDDSPSSSRHVL
ncbi:hypothetical protein QQF64_022710, partial [Cirrhinus molitorella]